MSDQDLDHKGTEFVNNIIKFSKEENVKIPVAGVKVASENLKLLKLGGLNPKGQAVVISAVVVRKSMHAAGISTKDEAMDCLIAVAKLGSTMAVGAAAAPATLGFSAYLALAVVAVEAYQVGNACFNHKDRAVSHAVRFENSQPR